MAAQPAARPIFRVQAAPWWDLEIGGQLPLQLEKLEIGGAASPEVAHEGAVPTEGVMSMKSR